MIFGRLIFTRLWDRGGSTWGIVSYPGPGFNFEHFETGCAPTNFKVFKVGVSALAGTRNFENFEIDGAPTKFKVFKVGVPALAGARNFENFEIDGGPTKFKVFKVGPSARGPNPGG